MSGLCLDAGALIALDRGDRAVVARLFRAVELGLPIVVPAGALAQAWRWDEPITAILEGILPG